MLLYKSPRPRVVGKSAGWIQLDTLFLLLFEVKCSEMRKTRTAHCVHQCIICLTHANAHYVVQVVNCSHTSSQWNGIVEFHNVANELRCIHFNSIQFNDKKMEKNKHLIVRKPGLLNSHSIELQIVDKHSESMHTNGFGKWSWLCFATDFSGLLGWTGPNNHSFWEWQGSCKNTSDTQEECGGIQAKASTGMLW